MILTRNLVQGSSELLGLLRLIGEGLWSQAAKGHMWSFRVVFDPPFLDALA